MVLYLNGDTANYKRWVIKARIKTLEKLIKQFPDSPVLVNRQVELEELKRELES